MRAPPFQRGALGVVLRAMPGAFRRNVLLVEEDPSPHKIRYPKDARRSAIHRLSNKLARLLAERRALVSWNCRAALRTPFPWQLHL